MCHSRNNAEGFLLVFNTIFRKNKNNKPAIRFKNFSFFTFIGLVFFTLLNLVAFAQTGSVSNPLSERENNPYSKYGIGEILNNNTAELSGMSNVTSAFANPFELNPDNPASYTFLKRTVMEGGIVASSRSISGAGLDYTSSTLSIAYLNVGVPIGKRSGLSFGLRPFSRTYYSLVDTLYNSPIGTAERSYNGEGSLNYAYIGYATSFKGFSLGVNVGYLFGNINNNTALVPEDTLAVNRAYLSEFANYTSIGGIYWKAGLMYEHKLPDSNYTIRIGGTFTMSQSLDEQLSSFRTSTYYFGDTTVNDTTYNPGQQRGKLKLPMAYSIGVMLAKTDIWNIGIDYAATNWSDFNSTPDTNMNYGIGSQSYKFSIGGEYSPTPVKIHKHFSRLTYRLGMYYGNDYIKIGNADLNFYGFTFGASLHFKPTHFSWVNLHTAFDIGRMGTAQNNLVQQTYFRWTMGISFNDKWFIPRKYD